MDRKYSNEQEWDCEDIEMFLVGQNLLADKCLFSAYQLSSGWYFER
jgi:hypothetical protein